MKGGYKRRAEGAESSVYQGALIREPIRLNVSLVAEQHLLELKMQSNKRPINVTLMMEMDEAIDIISQ